MVKLPTVCQVQGINHLIGPGFGQLLSDRCTRSVIKGIVGGGGGRVGSGGRGGGGSGVLTLVLTAGSK